MTASASTEATVTVRGVLSGYCCRLGAWLIKRGYRLDPDGGAAVVVVVHGEDHWSGSWHLGWTSQAFLAAELATYAAEVLREHATKLEKDNGISTNQANWSQN